MREGLPKGWVETRLEKCSYILDGYRNPISSDERNKRIAGKSENELYPYYGATGQVGLIDGYLIEGRYVLIGEDGAPYFDSNKNIAYIVNGKIWVNNHAHILDSLTDNYFLCHFLNQFDFTGYVTGTTRLKLTQAKLREIPIKLPPLNEQKRIVAKLDAIMPRIDAVKKRLDKVPGILKRFRQSVLTAAVTGRLTAQWREEHPEVESAEVLLKRIKKEKNKLYKQNKIAKPIIEEDIEFPIPSPWNWCRLSEIVLKMSTGPFGTMLHKSDYVDNGIPVINPTNIKDDKLIPLEKMMISKEKYSELSRYALQEGSIVIARRGDLSKCGIVNKNEIDWLCGTGSFFLEIAIDPVYFRFFYVSDLCQAPLNADSIGSTMSNLNQTVLANVLFPLPPIEEQKEIVRQVDKLFALADKVEAHYKKAKARVDKLSQSVLAKAFRGELVPQDPNDEPAEKLLERILEEKAKMEAQLKGARKRGVKKTVKKSEGGT